MRRCTFWRQLKIFTPHGKFHRDHPVCHLREILNQHSGKAIKWKFGLPVGLFNGQELRWFWESQATSSETRRGEELKCSARDKLRRKDRKCWLVTSVQSCCKVVTRTIFPILNLLFPSAEHRPCHIVWALRSPRHSLALRIFRWGSRPCPPELGLVSICLISVFSLRVICLLRAQCKTNL